jgi:F420-0:gamma-glutamyl ligase-like protein
MVEIRKTIYTMAGKAEEQVKNKTGFLGHLVGAAEAAVKTGKDVAQRVQEEVEARGGLGKIANDVTDR